MIESCSALQVHTYRAKPPPATPDILKCVLELLLSLSDSADLRQMHAKVRSSGALALSTVCMTLVTNFASRKPRASSLRVRRPTWDKTIAYEFASRRAKRSCQYLLTRDDRIYPLRSWLYCIAQLDSLGSSSSMEK